MKRVALKVAYIGTDFYGFQRQPGLRTIEGEILSALKETGLIEEIEKCAFEIAGRTDRGVHALGNVVSFLTHEKVIINQINDALPQSIKILAQADVPLRFKTRYALSRHYRYLIAKPCWNFARSQTELHFNLDKMMEAGRILEGTHNFRNFSRRSERSPIRTVDQVLIKEGRDSVQVDVTGESFLWNMVRKMVSVLINVGEDQLNPGELQEYFDPQKEVSVKPAPPEGLILMDVGYSGVEFKEDAYAKNSFISSIKKEYLRQQTTALSQKELIKSLMPEK